MRSLPHEARVTNLSGKAFCRHCLNDGFVVVAMRPATRSLTAPRPSTEGVYEELGPCPMCEVGIKVEFQRGAPWGSEGFWQGKDVGELKQVFSDHGWKVAPPDLQRSMLQAFGKVIGAVLEPPAAAGAAAMSAPPSPETEPRADTMTTSSGPFAGFGTLTEDATE